MKKLLFLLILAILANLEGITLAEAIQYDIYVDGNLPTDAIGTYSVANRDSSGIKTAYKTIQSAVNAATAGETIGIRDGLYTPSTYIDIRSKEGTDANNPIIVRAYAPTTTDANETVVIDGTYTAPSSLTGIIFIKYCEYIYVQDLTLRNFSGNGIGVQYADHCQIKNVVAHDNTGVGIKIELSNYAYIENCIVYDNGGTGIYLNAASYCTVDKNESYNNILGIRAAWSSGSETMSTYNTISNNLTYNNITDPENSDGIALSAGTRHNTVINNIIWGNADDGIDFSPGKGQGNDGDIVDGYHKGTCIWNSSINNIIFNQGLGGAGDGNGEKCGANSGGGHLVAYNISFNNRKAGFYNAVQTGFPGNCYYNNTAYYNGTADDGQKTRSGFWMDQSSDNPTERAILYNNISVDNFVHDSRIESNSVQLSDYNFWGNGDGFSGGDEHSLSGSPQFIDPGRVIETIFGSNWTIDEKLFYIRYQVEEKFSLADASPAKNAGRIIEGFHNLIAGDDGGEDIIWYGTKPDMGASIISADLDISDLFDNIPDTEDTDGTDTTEIPSIPEDNSSDTVEDTGSSTPDNTVSPIKIDPLPITDNTGTIETSSEYGTQANYSTIGPLFSASDSGLHIEDGASAKVRTIKVRGSIKKYDNFYNLAKKGWAIERPE